MRSFHRSPPRLRFCLFPCLLFWVVSLAPATGDGATLYHAFAFGFPALHFPGPVEHSGPTPVSAGLGDYVQNPHPNRTQSFWAFVSADLSLAGDASADAFTSDPQSACCLDASSSGTASFSGYDVLLSGPSGESTMASLNLSFDGVAGPINHGGAGASVGTSLIGPSGTVTDAGRIDASTGGSGLLSGWLGSGALAVTTSALLIGAGDVVTVGLSLSVSAFCNTDQVMTCGASSSVRSFSFAPTGPVFNLPDGWTANSVDGTIVNNMFIPEPSAALLLFGGLIGLAGWRRGRTE